MSSALHTQRDQQFVASLGILRAQEEYWPKTIFVCAVGYFLQLFSSRFTKFSS